MKPFHWSILVLFARIAPGAASGWLAYYFFDASKWGSFWAGAVVGFIASRLKLLPPWKESEKGSTHD